MHASIAMIAALAAAAPASGLVARGQDSNSFLADTAPQGYTQLISQISDGQVQNPTPAPPVEYPSVSVPVPTIEPPVVPSISTPVIIPSTPVVTLPVETTPVIPPVHTSVEVSLPVETTHIQPTTVAPPVLPSSIGTPVTSIVAPSQTTPVSPPETTPTNGAAVIKAFGSFGLIAGAAALFLA